MIAARAHAGRRGSSPRRAQRLGRQRAAARGVLGRLAHVVDPFERRLGRDLEERDRLGGQRLAARDLLGVGGGHERARELLAERGRGRGREPLQDRRKLEREQFHAASVRTSPATEGRLSLLWWVVSASELTRESLEIVWRDGELRLLGPTERELSVGQLVELAADPPANAGPSAQAAFAIVGLAQRAVSEGLVHPQLLRGGSSWFAFWGVTLDDSLQAELDAIAAAAPAASGAIDELLPHLVDRIARDRLDGVRLASPTRSPAMDAFLIGLAADQPDLPDGPSYASLERRLSRWVDSGLGELKESPWLLGFHLDERPGSDALALELWLHASDDPTLSLPASLLWQGSEGFEFVRDGDPYGDLAAQLDELAPLLAEGGIAFDEDEPSEVELDTEDTTFFLKHLMPLLEQAGVPVLLPSAWVRTPTRIRANLTATAARSQTSTGFMSTSDLAQFDWKLAVGDVDLIGGRAARARRREGAGRLRGRPLARVAPVGGRPRAAVPREAQGGRRRRRSRARRSRGSRPTRPGSSWASVALDPRSRTCSTATRASSRCRRRRR